ncbi:MAG: amidohydrolase family protein, partial [Clostridia bacterium]|nr:amidohydrolase family protein [Clostridia bacterium]
MAFDLLFNGVTIVTMDDDCPELKNAYLGIEGRKITWLSTEAPTEPATRTIENAHLVLMPGLYNTHTHLGMSVLRGYADEYTLDVWLNEHIWPAEAKLSREAVGAATALSVAEAIASGTVSFTDMYFFMPDLAELCLKAGCMANLTNGPM